MKVSPRTALPIRVCLAPDSVAVVRQKCREQLTLCDEWDDVSGTVARDDYANPLSQFLFDTCSMVKK